MHYVCVHDMDDYVRAVIERLCQEPDEGGVRIVRVYPDRGDDDTVTCEVEAPTREAFLCWLNEANVHSRGRWVEVDAPHQKAQAPRRPSARLARGATQANSAPGGAPAGHSQQAGRRGRQGSARPQHRTFGRSSLRRKQVWSP